MRRTSGMPDDLIEIAAVEIAVCKTQGGMMSRTAALTWLE